MQNHANNHDHDSKHQPDLTNVSTTPVSRIDFHRSTYEEQGYVLIRRLFTQEEVKSFQDESVRLLRSDIVDPTNIRTLFQMNSGSFPERIDPVVDVSPVFKALSADERLLGIVRSMIGSEVQLFKDKLILKMPGTEGYPMHQDYAWWSHLCPKPEHLLSVYVAIDGATRDNGAMEVFNGSRDRLVALARNLNGTEVEDIVRSQRGEFVLTEPGDVLIFHSLTPHRSERNTTEQPRRALYLSYNAAEHGDMRSNYYEYYREREGRAGTSFK